MSATVIKNSAAVILAVLALAALILGAYLPLVKARSYITALNTLPSVNSLEELVDRVMQAVKSK